MNRRRLLLLMMMVCACALVASGAAVGAPATESYDAYTAIAPPGAQTRGELPLSRYELDTHVDAGLTNPGGIVNQVPHMLAGQLWALNRFCVQLTLTVFEHAYSLDILTGRRGLLTPVAGSARSLWASLGTPFLTLGVLVCALWAIYVLLIQRNYADGLSRLALSGAYCVLAMLILLEPGIARDAVRSSNELALSLSKAQTRGAGQQASAAVQLKRVLVHEPWLALNLGGSHHCQTRTGAPARAAGATPRGRPIPPPGGSCASTSGAANKLLAHPAGSDARNDVFEKLKDGTPLQRRMVEIQQGGGGNQRVTLALALLAATAGAIVLIGGLAIGMLVWQIIALTLFALTPVVLVCSLAPGAGHEVFERWLRQLGKALIRKTIYALYLALICSLSLAIARYGAALNLLMAWVLQAALWWGLVIYSRRLSQQLTTRTRSHAQKMAGGRLVRTGAALASGGTTGAAAAMRRTPARPAGSSA